MSVPVEQCGALVTACPNCNHAIELPELHAKICRLADENKRLKEERDHYRDECQLWELAAKIVKAEKS